VILKKRLNWIPPTKTSEWNSRKLKARKRLVDLINNDQWLKHLLKEFIMRRKHIKRLPSLMSYLSLIRIMRKFGLNLKLVSQEQMEIRKTKLFLNFSRKRFLRPLITF